MKYIKLYEYFEYDKVLSILSNDEVNDIMDNSYDLQDRGISIQLDVVDMGICTYEDAFVMYILADGGDYDPFNISEVKEDIERLITTICNIGYEVYEFRYFPMKGKNNKDYFIEVSSSKDFLNKIDSIDPKLQVVREMSLYFEKK